MKEKNRRKKITKENREEEEEVEEDMFPFSVNFFKMRRQAARVASGERFARRP